MLCCAVTLYKLRTKIKRISDVTAGSFREDCDVFARQLMRFFRNLESFVRKFIETRCPYSDPLHFLYHRIICLLFEMSSSFISHCICLQRMYELDWVSERERDGDSYHRIKSNCVEISVELFLYFTFLFSLFSCLIELVSRGA